MKKILGILSILVVGNLGFSEDIDKSMFTLETETNTTSTTTANNENNSNEKVVSKEDEAYKKYEEMLRRSDEIEKAGAYKITNDIRTQATEEYMKASGMSNFNKRNIGAISKNFDFDAMLKGVDDIYNVLDKGSEITFNTVAAASDALTSALSIAGAFPTMAGAGVIGSNIQSILSRILAVKNRVDQLKEYKRRLDSVRSLGKEDLLTLSGINNTLKTLDGLVKTGVDIGDASEDFSKKLEKADLTTAEGWDLLLNTDRDILATNKDVLNKISGKENKKIREVIEKAKKTLLNINPKNENQNLQYLREQMNILISLTEQMISNDSLTASAMLVKENKEKEEQIAAKETQKAEAVKIASAIENNKKETEKMKLSNRFVGSVTGK
ncbi:hypothetical protein [Pseudostreptobacillus hongkongensis]|uniref:hypothetical protein n=1 Tax=Pseudostreptobacillus hongkongensis TaxID=1162717 RepID=UPI00082A35FE|nr:hypothetical protein [Pseudostreptobacillus hongkongensis]